jgi:F-type H+-transporting ATPase subunit delta
MSNEVLAYRYASALADVAQKHDKLETVRNQLVEIDRTLAGNREFDAAVATGRLSREEKRELVRSIAENAEADPLVSRFLEYLVDCRRIKLLSQMVRTLAEEADRRLGLARARVTSAVELNDTQRNKLKKKLEQATGKKIEVRWQTDENLLGGFQIRLDHSFYDASLRGKLKRLRGRLSHAG